MWLRRYTCFLVLSATLQSVAYGYNDNYTCVRSKKIGLTYRCENLFNLNVVDEIPENVKKIIFEDSSLVYIHGKAFARFGHSLISLDIHNSKVASMDSHALSGLRNLQSLSLYGNNLNYLYALWFTDLSNLRTLDVSFNAIVGIEYDVYKLLPNIENFYLDGNRIPSLDWLGFNFMTKLKRVNIGNNPWIWTYRALLMQLLDDRKIDHEDFWEDWRWINAVIWECYQINQMDSLNDQILNCVAMKLLAFTNEDLKFQNLTSSYDIRCHAAASRLISCSRSNSYTRTDEEAVGMSLQGILHAIKSTENIGDEFKLN